MHLVLLAGPVYNLDVQSVTEERRGEGIGPALMKLA